MADFRMMGQGLGLQGLQGRQGLRSAAGEGVGNFCRGRSAVSVAENESVTCCGVGHRDCVCSAVFLLRVQSLGIVLRSGIVLRFSGSVRSD